MSVDATSDEAAFSTLVEALRPWLSEVVFVGGWAHRLYRLHPLAQPVAYEPLLTRDADVAIPPPGRSAGHAIADALREAGFTEQLSGDSRPPVTRYVLESRGTGFYAEFLTPLIGSTRTRSGRLDVTVEVAGITAQKLRYLDLLLVAPWSVELERIDGLAVRAGTTARVPNVASYLAQKMLIHSRRSHADQAKDLLYIHDTIELFARSLPEARSVWSDRLKPHLDAKTLRRIERLAGTFHAELSDAASGASIEAAAASRRALAPAEIIEVCRAGLQEVFGTRD